MLIGWYTGLLQGSGSVLLNIAHLVDEPIVKDYIFGLLVNK